jgi:predicted nucleic acid-binding protein
LTRCYLDTNFLYVHLRSPLGAAAIEDWRDRVLSTLTVDGGVISALVLDELAYRLVLAWLRDDGDRDPLSTYRADARAVMRDVGPRLTATWQALDVLSLELQTTDHAVVARAKTLMVRPGLAPRDAFHAAHALEAGCRVIASSDPAFGEVPGLRLLAP